MGHVQFAGRPATNLRSVPGFAQIGPVPFSRRGTTADRFVKCGFAEILFVLEKAPFVRCACHAYNGR
jgi:hypothetical protein